MYREIKSCNRVLAKRWQEKDFQLHHSKLLNVRSQVAEQSLSPGGGTGPTLTRSFDEEAKLRRRRMNRKKLVLEEGKWRVNCNLDIAEKNTEIE